MSAALVAAVAAAAAVLLLPGRGGRARRRVSTATAGVSAATSTATSGASPAPSSGRAAVASLPTAASAATGGEGVAALAERLAGVARAGLPPARVWGALAARPGPHERLARAVLPWLEAGVPAGRALGVVAAQARAAGSVRAQLSCLAVALDACEHAGAPLAPSLEGLAAALRAQEEARRERETALAPARATAAVMTALPAVGLLLAAALGADPLRVLAGTSFGRSSLALGVSLWLGGRWWIRRLVAAATAG